MTTEGPDFSLDAFVKKHEPHLHTWLERKGASREDARDAVQEAFLSLWKNADTIEKKLAYVYTASKRQWLKKLQEQQPKDRDGRRLRLVSLSETDTSDLDRATPPGTDAYGVLEEKLEEAWVLAALRTLPPVQQRILALRSEGFRPKDIARQVGMSEATARSHLRHARSRLSTLTQPTE